ncbi:MULTISPECIES: di-heme oxidoredictase family protein [Cyanophyceae]|uniref:Thiol oxidoreductase n=1 Tax=Aphanothece cf. minutissima CCALA 015 TaxID=2107695 RepID=A0ABX5F7E4_9CHRO|nr:MULTISPECIES: di-heme oxidoredictase family protein [Cyanophyceae]MCP9797506.1 thiol oxidoreductase [Cyanobium sp. Lug-B]PSB36342.1 thiol oxidoreductase [Aphanothece cf. minutissima CCALA 015]
MARPSRVLRRVLLAGLALAVVLGLGLRQAWGAADPQQAAGAMTVANRTSAAFEQPAAGLTPAERERHQVADVLFDRTHVPLEGAPGAGLGPRFNAASCIACHVRNGRGRPLMGESLVRVALRNGQPVPGLGHQVRDRAVFGARPDAAVTVAWLEREGRRRPEIRLERDGSLDLSERSVARSLRVAPPLIGMGLLEAVPEEAILAHADPDDRDGDGISGRPHWLEEGKGTPRLGRFGWKAGAATVRDQTAAAFLNDMGLTSPGDIGTRELELVTYYSQTLGAPRTALPATSPVVRRGRELFGTLQCARCHVPRLTTGRSPGAVAGAINGQPIWPYTDLLLHDMGPGLDDGVAEKGAPGQEWRTAPLWGLGLAQRVNGSVGFLHDGRARTIEEAILWHGGEAAAARERFTALAPLQRRSLLDWLQQL